MKTKARNMQLHTETPAKGCLRLTPPAGAPEVAQSGPLADETIIQRVLDGDKASFELIMRRYNQRLFRIIRSILRDDDESEDVLQETYVRAFEHLSQFEGRSLFSTWLTRIAIYEASSRRRKRKRIRTMDLEHSEHLRAATDRTLQGRHNASMSELHDVLVKAVEALPEDLRTVFVLRAVEGLDTLEAAECLDLTTSNIKVRLHRARTLLQTWIDRQLGEDVRRLYQFDGERCDRIVRGVLDRLAGR